MFLVTNENMGLCLYIVVCSGSVQKYSVCYLSGCEENAIEGTSMLNFKSLAMCISKVR